MAHSFENMNIKFGQSLYYELGQGTILDPKNPKNYRTKH